MDCGLLSCSYDFGASALHIGGREISLSIFAGVICAIIAAGKGRSALGWFVVGALTSCVGVIIVCCLSDVAKERKKSEEEMRRQFAAARAADAQEHRPRPSPPPAWAAGEAAWAPPVPPVHDEPLVWYWADQGRAAGPVTREALRSLRRAGAVVPTTLVWRDGYPDWRPYSAADELA
jgi:hypothetical protein